MGSQERSILVQTENQSENSPIKSLEVIFEDYKEKKSSIEKISSFVDGKSDYIAYFLAGNDVQSYLAKEIFKIDGAISALDAEFWSKVIELTDVLECMPATQRNEWSEMIHTRKTPSFTRENVIPTLQSLLLSRDSFLAKKVDGIFQNLSGNHVTNSPMGFRSRMIIENVIGSYSVLNYRKVEYIHDLRSIIAKINGRDSAKTTDTRTDLGHIERSKQFGEWFDFDGGAFRLKLFKKGTAHLEIHPEIAVDLNNILSSLYPSSIPASVRNKENKQKEFVLKNDLLDPEVLKELGRVLDAVSRYKSVFLSKCNMHEKICNEVSEVLSFIGGTESGGTWDFSYAASEVLATIIRTGCIPDKESHQYYSTKDNLAYLVVELADIQDSE